MRRLPYSGYGSLAQNVAPRFNKMYYTVFIKHIIHPGTMPNAVCVF
jgi:hypothetical protein